METLHSLFSIFRVFLPFMRELLFGDKDTSEEAVRRNKIVVFLMICLLIVFLFYYHNTYEFDELSVANSHLDEQNAVLKARLEAALQNNRMLQNDLSIERARLALPDVRAPTVIPAHKSPDGKSHGGK